MKNRKIMLGGGGSLVSFDEFKRALEKYDATHDLLVIYSFRSVIETTDLEMFKLLEITSGCMSGHKDSVDIDALQDLLMLDDEKKPEWNAKFDKLKSVFDSFRKPKNTTNNLPITTGPLADSILTQHLEVDPTITPANTASDTNSTPVKNNKRPRQIEPLPKPVTIDAAELRKRNNQSQIQYNNKTTFIE